MMRARPPKYFFLEPPCILFLSRSAARDFLYRGGQNWLMRGATEESANDLHMVTSWCHYKTPSFISCFRMVLPFWYRLTQVVLEKRPLNCFHQGASYKPHFSPAEVVYSRNTKHGPIFHSFTKGALNSIYRWALWLIVIPKVYKYFRLSLARKHLLP